MHSFNSIPHAQASRRFDLDWIRILAFGLLILYHLGMYYVTWDWHIKSPRASTLIEPLMRLSNPWRLCLLFFVSGVATRFMLDKWTPGQLARARSTRLLIPLIFGMLIIVPPQSYYEVVEKLNFHDGFEAFYARYLARDHSFCPNSKCITLPTWNHLWFIPYLWVYTLLAAAAWAWWPRVVARVNSLQASGFAVLLWPFVLLALARVLLAPQFPSTHNLAWDWYNHAQYGLMFALGLMWAKADGVWARIVRLRWWALGLAVLSYAALQTAISLNATGVILTQTQLIVMRSIYGLDQWSAILAVLGFGSLWLNHDNPARRYLTEAIFPYYIVHQTVIVVVAHNLQSLALPLPVEVAILLITTATACVLTYELVRRVSWLRPLFGLTPQHKT
jgi:glucans biosynthesis protein C